MERITYQHPIYSDWKIASFPPFFKANNVRQVLDFQADAIAEIDMATKEALQHAAKSTKFFFAMQHLPLTRLLTRVYMLGRHPSFSSVHNPYLCFFDIQDAYHWPAYDPAEETMISLTDPGERSILEATHPSTSDFMLLSPYPDKRSLIPWKAAKETSWNCTIGLQAIYTQRHDQTVAKYSLIYLSKSDEIDRGKHHRPIESVTGKQTVTAGMQI